MPYTTHTFEDGEVLTADTLNNVIAGIDERGVVVSADDNGDIVFTTNDTEEST